MMNKKGVGPLAALIFIPTVLVAIVSGIVTLLLAFPASLSIADVIRKNGALIGILLAMLLFYKFFRK